MTTARIEVADARAFVRTLPERAVDIVVTDPPHEGLERHRAHGTTTRLVKDWFEVLQIDDIVGVLADSYGALGRDGYLWVFADAWLEHQLVKRMTGGVLGVRRPIGWCWWGSWIWTKTGKPGMGYHGRRNHERIVLFEKGAPTLRDLGQRDVLEAPRPSAASLGGRRPYPTEKPVEVIRALLRCSVAPGAVVLDPFCGSGAVAEAAKLAGCSFIGCDTSERAVEIARGRA